jgi:hypothetical protein
MSGHPVNPSDSAFLAAIQGGPYLVITSESVRGFQSYSDAEAFASRQESMNSTSVTIALVHFKEDGTPDRMTAFPTTHAGCSFERARREFGLWPSLQHDRLLECPRNGSGDRGSSGGDS